MGLCKHQFVRINDVSVCKNCGLTIINDGNGVNVMFDRRFTCIGKTKKKRRKK